MYACLDTYKQPYACRYDTCADELSSREREKLCNEHIDKIRDDMLSRMQVLCALESRCSNRNFRLYLLHFMMYSKYL